MTTRATEPTNAFVRRKLNDLRSREWSPHEYPLWAVELSKRADEVLAAAEDDDEIGELVTALAELVESRRAVLLGGEDEADEDSQLAIVRESTGARRVEFWWVW